MPVLPNFFIVGAPKAGTTSLYHFLDRHPQIYMSPIKEPCYFASEIRPENFSDEHQPFVRREVLALEEYLAGPMTEKRFGGMVLDWENYLKLFANAKAEKAIGEASVCYLWSKTAATGIAARIPDAKIIMILRNPADRAFSQYLHTVTNGLVRKSFGEQIRTSTRPSNGKLGLHHPFLEFGQYYEQVKRYLNAFPLHNIRIYLYEEDRPPTDLLEFLTVDTRSSEGGRHMEPRVPRAIATSYFLKKFGMWDRAKRFSPRALHPLLRKLVFKPRKELSMEAADRRYLIEYYKEDIGKLADLLNRDLTHWLR